MRFRDYRTITHHQSGLSLIELMITLTLSSLLMLGVMRMFIDSTNSSATDSALAQVQDSARIAMEMIKRDVRMAGYRGSCVSADTEATSGSVIDFDRQTVRGVEGNGTNSDKLSVLKAEEWDMSNPVRIIGFTSSAAPNTVQLTRPIHTKETEMLLVSDCHQLAAFYPECTDMTDCSSVKPKTAISFKDYVLPENCIQSDTESCPHLYTLGTENGMTYSVEEIGKLEGINDNNRRKGSDNRQLFALYRNDVEMVEGVENLQILYGLENNAQTQYCDAKQLEDSSACPGNITHIRISMVVASSNNVHSVSESQSFDILNHGSDGTLTKNDRRLRRVFTTTIQLRNKR